jgi:cytochrome c-type biogenesis protein CcmH
VVELIGRVEQHLREHPQDGKGWDVVAPVYLRLGRYADAAHAFAEANRLEGETVRRLLGFAEATMMAEDGVVSEAARKAAQRVLELEPGRIEARIWLTLAREQDGDLAGAAAAYRELLAGAPADAPWRAAVSQRLDLVDKKIKAEPVEHRPVAALPAPPAATSPAAAGEQPDVAAMSPADREAFITSMVDRLATRLKADGRDLAGWIRLARAYKVLGREDDARAAIASARENFSGDRASLDEIDKSEQSLGITGNGEAAPP